MGQGHVLHLLGKAEVCPVAFLASGKQLCWHALLYWAGDPYSIREAFLRLFLFTPDASALLWTPQGHAFSGANVWSSKVQI